LGLGVGDVVAQEDVKRKLAAILAADVAGYSRLMGDDERATIATLREYREIFRRNIEQDDGRVVDMAGDSVLAVFDSAAGAVQAATKTQGDLAARNEGLPEDRRMQFRIGVNLGDIEQAEDGTVYGDGVNVAARLEAMANPGGINVSGSVFDSVRSKIAAPFDFLGEQEVKNIAEPVRAYRLLNDSEEPSAQGLNKKRQRSRLGLTVVAIIAIAVVVGIVWFRFGDRSPKTDLADAPQTENAGLTAPTGPSIAVLPFTNLSGKSDQDYFAEGISEDVLNQLSPVMGIQVISRSSSFRYRGSQVDPMKAGAELSADYLVVGGVRRASDNVRVTAELVEAGTGKKLWSDTYDRNLSTAELFASQDDIARSIVATIADEYGIISQQIRQDARYSNADLGSYECVLRAYHYFEYFNQDNHLIARDCLENAVEEDPQYAEAWGWLAILYANEHAWNFNLREDPLGRALNAGDTAVRIDRNNQMAWEGKSAAHFFRGEWEEFHPAAQKAISINPNDVSTIGNIAWYYGNFGRYDHALPLIDRALLLSPFPPAFYFQPYWQKTFTEGDHELALDYARKNEIPGFYLHFMMLAATYSELDDQAQAANNIEYLLEANPVFVETYRSWAAAVHWPSELTDKVAASLNRAGLEIPD
jgi:adenylate cyclase